MRKLLLILLLSFSVHVSYGAYTTPTDITCKDGKQEYAEAQKYMPIESRKDAKNAMEWLTKAYNKGCGDAAFDAGLIAQSLGDNESMQMWHKRAAELNHPDGLIMHGSHLAETGKDKAKGCEMIRRSDKLGGKSFLPLDQILGMLNC